MAAYRIIETESQSQNALESGAFQTRRIGRCDDIGDFVAMAIVLSFPWYPQGAPVHSFLSCTPGREVLKRVPQAPLRAPTVLAVVEFPRLSRRRRWAVHGWLHWLDTPAHRPDCRSLRRDRT